MARDSKSLFWIWALAWLPAGVVFVSLTRDGATFMPLESLSMMLMAVPMALLSLIPVAPCGLPLGTGMAPDRTVGASQGSLGRRRGTRPANRFRKPFRGAARAGRDCRLRCRTQRSGMDCLCGSTPVTDGIPRDSRQLDVASKRRFHVIDDTHTLRQKAVDIHQGVLGAVQARAPFYCCLVTTP